MSLPVRRPDAAGIDIGAEEIWVVVSPDRDREPVRRFGSFTRELLALADWLLSLSDHQCGDGGDRPRLDSVVADPGGAKAGSDAGQRPLLSKRRRAATDAGDCQWLQYLHSVGLRKGSCRPQEELCAVRTLLRHRDNLVKAASVLTQQLQKALDQMNIKLHDVLSEVTGVSEWRFWTR